MAFYVIPPSGSVGIDLLRKWTVIRAKFLRDIYDCQDDMHAVEQLFMNEVASSNYQYLIEGTPVDSVTHFVLRLACAGDYAAEHAFMSAEIALFHYRLRSLGEAGVKRFMGQFYRLRKYFLNLTDTLQPSVELADVRELLSALNDDSIDWKSITAGYMSFTLERQRYENSQFPDSFPIAVPFRFMPRLVAQRKVQLSNGMALLSPIQLPHVLAAVFQKWLKYGILLARIWQPHVMSGDDRFKQLFRECRNLVCGHFMSSQLRFHMPTLNEIKCDNIDDMVAKFPPCMIHLHNCLRQRHRLRHMSRILYTLFLKDVGLSVDEALRFWSGEYCKPTADAADAGKHACQHSWHQSASRYTYSVKHLYGLVGKRANYRSYSCQTIQNQPWSVGEEAICPFKHHSQASLRQLLQLSSEFALDKICSLADAEDYTSACRLYLESLTVESYGDVCSGNCSSSHVTMKSTVGEAVSPGQTGGQPSDVEVEETSDSGYDSAQSCQPVSENYSTSNASTTCSTSSSNVNAQNAAVACMSHPCQRHTADHLLSNMIDCGICNVQDHIIGSHCDLRQRKLHAPVDFYTSFNFLAAGLRSLAAS